jgi:hypothetical protein
MGASERVQPVIDAHTHLFPPDVVRDRASFLERDAWFGELYVSPRTRLATPEDLVASMDRAGIATSVVCGWPWRDSGLCREQNGFLAEVRRRYPERIAWLAIVNPAERSAVADAERAMSMGASGLGELNADAQGFAWEDRHVMSPVAEYCTEAGVPLLMHCSEPVGHAYPGKGTATPDRILAFLQSFPSLKVIAAHWGGGLPFYELMPEVALATRNVVYDSAASTYLYDFSMFAHAERLVGEDRIVVGTDYPLLRQKAFLQRVRDSGISPAALPRVLGGTAARVFGLAQEA